MLATIQRKIPNAAPLPFIQTFVSSAIVESVKILSFTIHSVIAANTDGLPVKAPLSPWNHC